MQDLSSSVYPCSIDSSPEDLIMADFRVAGDPVHAWKETIVALLGTPGITLKMPCPDCLN